MKPAYWIVCGLLLAGAANYHGPGPDAPGLGASSSTYLPSAILVNAGFVCFAIAWRGAIANLWSALTGKRRNRVRKPKKSSAMAKDTEPSLDFDADAAFSRYMDRRAASDVAGVPQSPLPSPAAPARAQAGFGRKVI